MLLKMLISFDTDDIRSSDDDVLERRKLLAEIGAQCLELSASAEFHLGDLRGQAIA